MYKNIMKDSIRNHYKNIVNLITFIFNRFKINFMYYLEISAALIYSILFLHWHNYFDIENLIFFSSQFLFSTSKSLDTIEIRILQASVTPLELTSQKSVHRIMLHSWNSTIISRALYSFFRLLPVASFFRLPTATCLTVTPCTGLSFIFICT